METVEQKAKEYAITCHSNTNHKYDGQPYSLHLSHVVRIANEFKHLFPETDHDLLFAAAWCHDVIEDTRETFNDVKAAVGEEIAELAYTLTNEKGKNREERANKKYYDGINEYPGAVFIKLCDRIANMEYSIEGKSSMAKKYAAENKKFMHSIYHPDDFMPMYERLVQLEMQADALIIKSRSDAQPAPQQTK